MIFFVITNFRWLTRHCQYFMELDYIQFQCMSFYVLPIFDRHWEYFCPNRHSSWQRSNHFSINHHTPQKNAFCQIYTVWKIVFSYDICRHHLNISFIHRRATIFTWKAFFGKWFFCYWSLSFIDEYVPTNKKAESRTYYIHEFILCIDYFWC